MQNSNLWQGALNGIFSAATTRALDTWKILQGHRWLDFFSSNMEEAQDFLDGVDISIKEAKSLGWIKQKVLVGSKSMRCEAQIARFAYAGAEFPRAYARIPKPVSTGIENESFRKGLWHSSTHTWGVLISHPANLFSRLAFGEKIVSHRPWDARESYYVTIQLVHFGSFKRHILYFCESIVKKIRSHWGVSARSHILCCQCF